MKVKLYNSYIFMNFENIDNKVEQLQNSMQRIRNIIHNIENNMTSWKYAIIRDIVEFYFTKFESIPACIYIVSDNHNDFVMGIDYDPKVKEVLNHDIDKKIRVYNDKVIISDYKNDNSINIIKFDKDTLFSDFMKQVLY